MTLFGLIANGVVAALLAVTLVYCWRLDRRLKALHAGTDGLRDVVAALDRATERAQTSLSALKTEGSATALGLKSEHDKAVALIEELKLMVASADRVANRLAEQRQGAPQPPQGEPRQAMHETPSIYQALRQAR